MVNGVQKISSRYHYKTPQPDYTYKDKKKSQLQLLWNIYFSHANHTLSYLIHYLLHLGYTSNPEIERHLLDKICFKGFLTDSEREWGVLARVNFFNQSLPIGKSLNLL